MSSADGISDVGRYVSASFHGMTWHSGKWRERMLRDQKDGGRRFIFLALPTAVVFSILIYSSPIFFCFSRWVLRADICAG